jgi:hypothetical protein
MGFFGPANRGREPETEHTQRNEKEVNDVDVVDEGCCEVGIRWPGRVWNRLQSNNWDNVSVGHHVSPSPLVLAILNRD